jgi:hypothetical protein
LSREGWLVPATLGDVSDAAEFLLAVLDPAAAENPNRVVMLTRLLATRDYTAAELDLVKREAPFRNHYGQGLKLDVLQEIVDEHREVRARLARPITARERDALLDRLHAEGVTPEHFPCCGFNERNEPLYRYRAEPLTGPPPVALLDEPKRPDTSDRGRGADGPSAGALADFIKVPGNGQAEDRT